MLDDDLLEGSLDREVLVAQCDDELIALDLRIGTSDGRLAIDHPLV